MKNNIKIKKLVKVLNSKGYFQCRKSKGGHTIFKNLEGKRVSVPLNHCEGKYNPYLVDKLIKYISC